MGKRSTEELTLTYDELVEHLQNNHAIYMRRGSNVYYITDANEHYWRAQDTSKLNHKGHYTDCSDLCPTLSEFLSIPFLGGAKIADVFSELHFFASIPGEKE